jgi:hypothetical protein
MPLLKTVLIASIGVPASFHTVRAVTIDLEQKQSAIQVASFYSREVAEEGAHSIGTATVQVDALPTSGEDLTAFCERALSAPVPAGVDAASAGNRFVFADAEIVANATPSAP